jgi:hypothetical protein
VGWQGGHCGHCEFCQRGDFVYCQFAQIPGISYDGGYADYMIAPPAPFRLYDFDVYVQFITQKRKNANTQIGFLLGDSFGGI